MSEGPPVAAARAAARARGLLPRGTLAVGVGLGVLGVASFAYLGLAARALDPTAFAELSVVWTVLFTLGPGLFLPLEQEVGRELAAAPDARRPGRLLRRSVVLAGSATLVLVAIAAAVWPFVGDRLLGGDVALFVAMIAANACLALVHPSRGVLAGTGRFGRYGLQLGLDGALRTVGAAVLLVAGVHDVVAYALVLTASQLVAVAVSFVGLPWRAPGSRSAPSAGAAVGAIGDPATGPSADPTVRLLARAVGIMVVGTLAAQVLANLGTVLVKAWATPAGATGAAAAADAAAAGRFLTALVIARVPLFLFAALQASLLPGLAAMFARHDHAAVRQAMTRLLAVLGAIGAAGVIVIAAAGPDIAALLFGSDYRSQRGPLIVLSAGAAVFMIASAVAQILLAVRARRSFAAGWVVSVVAFAAVVTVPASLPMRVSLAFLAGSVVAGAWFSFALRRSWRHTVLSPDVDPVSAAPVAP